MQVSDYQFLARRWDEATQQGVIIQIKRYFKPEHPQGYELCAIYSSYMWEDRDSVMTIYPNGSIRYYKKSFRPLTTPPKPNE
jgi:hypothetical protein